MKNDPFWTKLPLKKKTFEIQKSKKEEKFERAEREKKRTNQRFSLEW